VQRFLTPLFAVFRATTALVLVAGLVLTGLNVTQAAGSKQLQRVRGTIGFQTAAAGTDFKAVFGKLDLPDDDFAVTRAASAAVLAMPDSSLISLGENTNVQVGAFTTTAAGPGSTVTIGNGALRFDVRRPTGGVANYRFVTVTSQTAVRGTVGLLSFINGITTVGCLQCAADSVTVTVGTQTLTLVTGQFVTISAAGAITTGAIGTVVGTFSAVGVPVSAQASAAAAGLPAGGVLGTGVSAGVAAGAAAAIGIGVGVGVSSGASPQPNQSGPVPNATPTGTVNLSGRPKPIGPPDTRRSQAEPVPGASPVAGPSPPAGSGAPFGRLGR